MIEKSNSEVVRILDRYELGETIRWIIHSGTKDHYDIRKALMNYYMYDCIGYEDVVEALKEMSCNEFREYLSDRYRIRWCEITTYIASLSSY